MQESLGTCARCGEPLPADARFCPNCGAPVAALSTEERKVVTVMFADLVGSTKLSTRLDPERFRQVTATFFGAVSEELESLRGRAEKYVGDAYGTYGWAVYVAEVSVDTTTWETRVDDFVAELRR